MTKKEKFMCSLRRFRRNYFPTRQEKEDLRSRKVTKDLIRSGKDINYYFSNVFGK